MQLDSVRELKQRARQMVLQPMIAASPQALGLAFAATDVSNLRAVQPQRLFALGVARGSDGGYRLAIRLQRHSLALRRQVDKLSAMARGEVDVRFVGRIQKRAAPPWYQQTQRPLLIGCSIAHRRVTAGTLGAFVQRVGEPGTLYALSNNHVLANENNAKLGDAILQPGPLDGGTASGRVGKLAAMVRLKKTRPNLLDCALAELDTSDGIDPQRLRSIGRMAGVSADPVDEGQRVQKLGRTTGHTRGRITAFELDDVVVAYDIGNLSFDQQIEIEGEGDSPFSDGGDSGSLIVDMQRRAVALLFAGTEQGGNNGRGLTYANPIQPVLDALHVQLP